MRQAVRVGRRRFAIIRAGGSTLPLPQTVERVTGWMLEHRAAYFRYMCFVQLAVGLFLVGLGHVTGKDHLRLIQHGDRTTGTIIDYKFKYLSGRPDGLVRWESAFFAIVRFQAEGRTIQFEDWLGQNMNVPK